jgi:hypothetical protein
MFLFALIRFQSLLTHIFRGNFFTFVTAYKLCKQCFQEVEISAAELKRSPKNSYAVVNTCGGIFCSFTVTRKGRKGAELFEFCFSHKMPMTSFALKRFRSLLTHIFRGIFFTFGTAFKLCKQCCQLAEISAAELRRTPSKFCAPVKTCCRIFGSFFIPKKG